MQGGKPKSCEHCGHETNPNRKYTPPTECREREVHGSMHWICSECESKGAPYLKPSEVIAPDFSTRDNHYGGKTTEQAAFDAEKSAHLNKTHYAILGALALEPMTPDQVAGFFKMVLNTARARMSDLRDAGLITPTGEKRDTLAGKEAFVMRPTLPSEREQERAA